MKSFSIKKHTLLASQGVRWETVYGTLRWYEVVVFGLIGIILGFSVIKSDSLVVALPYLSGPCIFLLASIKYGGSPPARSGAGRSTKRLVARKRRTCGNVGEVA